MNAAGSRDAWTEWESVADRMQRRRWLISSFVVAGALAAFSLAAMRRPAYPREPDPPPLAAIVVALADEVRSPPPSVEAEGQRQMEAGRAMPAPVQPLSPVATTPLPAEIELPRTEETTVTSAETGNVPTPQTSAPRGEEAPLSAEVAASPQASAVSLAESSTRADFQQRLLGHLQRHKRYPRSARMRSQQGAPLIRFTMTRDGRVTARRLERSSGHAALDEESLALLDRAQPLPGIPPELSGDRLEIVVPIEFFIR